MKLSRVLGGSTGVLALALCLSGAGLLCGPLILSLGRGRALTAAIVEGMTLGLLPTMLVLRLLPHVVEGLGPSAIGLAALAFLALRGFDRAHHRAAARVGRAFIYSALVLHSFTDGVSLAAALAATPGRGAVDVTLALAFVVHRLPEGLFIATTLLPSYGPRRTLVRTLGLVVATFAGGIVGGALLPHLPERVFDAVVAVGLGAMLQLVLHSHADRVESPGARGASALALLAGVAIAVAVPAPHDLLKLARPDELSIAQSLGPLFIATAPMLLLALLLAAALHATIRLRPPRAGEHGLVAAARGLGLAFSLPVGPCDAVPVARGLLGQGAPFASATTFSLAAPALGLPGLLLSVRLLGLSFSGLRIAVAVALALAAGLALGEAQRRGPPPRSTRSAVEPPTNATATLTELLLRAVDRHGAWYLAGLAAAAVIEAAALPLPTGALVLGLACCAVIPLNLPLVGLTPVAAVLVHKGLPVHAALAFLVVGPAASWALLRLVAHARGLAAAAVLIALLAAVGALAGLPLVEPPSAASVPEMHALLAGPHPVVELLASAAMAGLLVSSLLRLGPRLWFAQLGIGGEVLALDEHPHHDPDEPHA